MTMDMTVDSTNNRETKTQQQQQQQQQSAPKRSFDVAFLTGAKEKEQPQPQPTPPPEDEPTAPPPPGPLMGGLLLSLAQGQEDKAGQVPSAHGGRSAFKKVGKQQPHGSHPSGASASGGSGMETLMPSAYPFSFPAIATTLSLQLLQQNTTKGLAMSLFNPMMPHTPKSYGHLLGPAANNNNNNNNSRGGRSCSESANLIEDYLRAQASLYQQQEKEMNAVGMFSLTKPRLGPSSGPSESALSLVANVNGYNFAPGVEHHRTPRTGTPAGLAAGAGVVSTGTGGGPGSGPGTIASGVMMPPAPVMAPPAMMPPGLAVAGLGAPSQNVCAKCNLSFRMTSDLVYHMRSQHRREADPVRQKRQEKLRCPVCGENFRERHHLTRHMTSHDDREVEIK